MSVVDAGIDKASLFEEIKYKPRPDQWSVHNSIARFQIACCGRRWGKSFTYGHDLTADMFIPDNRFWIVGPTYALGEKEFRVVHNDLIRMLKLGSKIKSSYNVKQGDMRIEMPWNTILEVKSADRPDSLVGEGLNGVIMSESALHNKTTWEMYIEPALADFRGWAKFPSTPRGYNYFHDLYQMGRSGKNPEYESWHFPSWANTNLFPTGFDPYCNHDNCTCDPEMIRIQRVVSDFHFAQEYGAEFTAFEGKIFGEFDRNNSIKSIDYNPAWKNYWVFDYGFADPFVCLDIMVDPSDNVYVWREYQVRYKSTFEHGVTLKNRENPRGFHVDGMFGDPRGADESATLIPILGQIRSNPVPWILGIEAIKRSMKPQLDGKTKFFIDPVACPETLRQIENLRVPDIKEGKNSRRANATTAQEGQHNYDDHGADALRYFFNELFVLGIGGSLSDVYAAGQSMGGKSAITYNSPFQQTDRISL